MSAAALTDEWSGGRLGYIHIQGMNIPSFEEFERMLFAAADGKEGLLVDVRFNGGGWTTDYLMAVLMVQRHAYTVPRGADSSIQAYPQSRLPLAAWTRPAATICNEDSYSNAEIFSHAFKSLERGPLVGWPTFGAVISTGGTRTLDGRNGQASGTRMVCGCDRYQHGEQRSRAGCTGVATAVGRCLGQRGHPASPCGRGPAGRSRDRSSNRSLVVP